VIRYRIVRATHWPLSSSWAVESIDLDGSVGMRYEGFTSERTAAHFIATLVPNLARAARELAMAAPQPVAAATKGN
jgi:hypothetical protein